MEPRNGGYTRASRSRIAHHVYKSIIVFVGTQRRERELGILLAPTSSSFLNGRSLSSASVVFAELHNQPGEAPVCVCVCACGEGVRSKERRANMPMRLGSSRVERI